MTEVLLAADLKFSWASTPKWNKCLHCHYLVTASQSSLSGTAIFLSQQAHLLAEKSTQGLAEGKQKEHLRVIWK